MKNLILLPSATIACLFALAPAQLSAQPAQPAKNVCLSETEIQRTDTPNDRTIMFHMVDGTVWRNDLATPCPSLSISAWSEVVRGDEICANQQTIRVPLTGAICRLGNFTKVSIPDKAK